MSKRKSSVVKKLFVGLIVLVVIIVGVGGFIGSNLDSIIKTAVEKYGSEATQTKVQLNRVRLAITSGEGSISGFRVGNPQGFSSNDAIKVGSVSVKVNAQSIAGNGPIVIDEIAIDGPQINYEVTAEGNSNLQTIQKNTMSYAGVDKAGSKKQEKAEAKDGGRKLIIKDLYVRDGKVGVSHALLQGKNLDAMLPVIHITNIGKNSGGATMAEVAEQVLGSITAGAMKAANVDIAKELKGAVTEKVKGALGKQLNKVGVPLDGLFGE